MTDCERLNSLAVPSNEFGRGLKGVVYKYEDDKLIKQILFRSDEDDASYNNEVGALTILKRFEGVAPKIYDSYVCNDRDGKETGYIIMEKIHGVTLEKYLNPANTPGPERYVDDRKLRQFLPILMKKLSILKSAKLQHNDLHDLNIIVIQNGSTIDLRFIDFGDASLYTNDVDYDEICNTLLVGYNVSKRRIVAITGKDFKFWGHIKEDIPDVPQHESIYHVPSTTGVAKEKKSKSIGKAKKGTKKKSTKKSSKKKPKKQSKKKSSKKKPKKQSKKKSSKKKQTKKKSKKGSKKSSKH
jgi:hypothetical protein